VNYCDDFFKSEKIMVNYRIIERPAFDVVGKKGWLAEQDDFFHQQI